MLSSVLLWIWSNELNVGESIVCGTQNKNICKRSLFVNKEMLDNDKSLNKITNPN